MLLMLKMNPAYEWKSYHKVCSRHFPQFVNHASCNRLHLTAVPCLNLPDFEAEGTDVTANEAVIEVVDEIMEIEYADDPDDPFLEQNCLLNI
jgi:hypothetical protein